MLNINNYLKISSLISLLFLTSVANGTTCETRSINIAGANNVIPSGEFMRVQAMETRNRHPLVLCQNARVVIRGDGNVNLQIPRNEDFKLLFIISGQGSTFIDTPTRSQSCEVHFQSGQMPTSFNFGDGTIKCR